MPATALLARLVRDHVAVIYGNPGHSSFPRDRFLLPVQADDLIVYANPEQYFQLPKGVRAVDGWVI